LFVWALNPNFSSLKQRPFADTFSGLNASKILNVVYAAMFVVIVDSW
jgi:hypothetical protein